MILSRPQCHAQVKFLNLVVLRDTGCGYFLCYDFPHASESVPRRAPSSFPPKCYNGGSLTSKSLPNQLDLPRGIFRQLPHTSVNPGATALHYPRCPTHNYRRRKVGILVKTREQPVRLPYNRFLIPSQRPGASAYNLYSAQYSPVRPCTSGTYFWCVYKWCVFAHIVQRV